MANTIVIKQGNRQLQDVEQITPDTRVNQQAVIKYPATDLNNGISAESWTEDTLDGATADPAVQFDNPHAYVNPDEEAEESGTTESGTTETGETETGTTETGETETGTTETGESV